MKWETHAIKWICWFLAVILFSTDNSHCVSETPKIFDFFATNSKMGIMYFTSVTEGGIHRTNFDDPLSLKQNKTNLHNFTEQCMRFNLQLENEYDLIVIEENCNTRAVESNSAIEITLHGNVIWSHKLLRMEKWSEKVDIKSSHNTSFKCYTINIKTT